MQLAHLPAFAALRAFEVIGRLGGIRRAADALRVSHAVISRHLRSLECALGAPLFDRNAGQLTTAGLIYHRRISGIMTELLDATDDARNALANPLVIACAPGLALHWLTARLTGFSTPSTSGVVELRALDQAPDLAGDNIHADIRYVSGGAAGRTPRDVVMVELARPGVFPVASPGFLKSLSLPIEDARDFSRLPLIEERNSSEWDTWLDAQSVRGALSQAVARYGHAHLCIAAAKAGQGIALANRFLIAEELAEGRLLAVRAIGTPLIDVPLGAYALYVHHSRWDDPALARFRKWIVQQFNDDGPNEDNF